MSGAGELADPAYIEEMVNRILKHSFINPIYILNLFSFLLSTRTHRLTRPPTSKSC